MIRHIVGVPTVGAYTTIKGNDMKICYECAASRALSVAIRDGYKPSNPDKVRLEMQKAIKTGVTYDNRGTK